MPSRGRLASADPVGRESARASRSERDPHSEQLVEIQRMRLIAGAVCAIEELGYAQVTVGQITRRASVSRRTFYELFSNREECLAAVMEDVIGALAAELSRADLQRLAWREQVRGGLAVILGFFDREPALARVCVVQALRGGPEVLRRREEVLSSLASAIDEGRGEGARGAGCSTLTAEGLVGAAFGIVYARLLKGERMPLVGLLGELTGMIVLPYLGTAAARREQAKRVPLTADTVRLEATPKTPMSGDPLQGMPVRLTYRTARVLECVSEYEGASNRVVSDYAGVTDQGQISKLLARLERVGLLINTGPGHAKGEPNAWRLTQRGERLARSIRAGVSRERRVA